MPSKFISHSWHVFTACNEESNNDLFTVEVCMTELDRVLARKFFKHPNMASNEMTEVTGISDINPNALICDFVFDPCGYSMNGIDGDRYSTIHVTPEDGFSYASYECVGSIYDDPNDIINILKKVVQVFRPGTMSISTTSTTNEVWTRIAKAVEPLGMKCRSCTMDDFPSTGSVVFQTFTSCRK